jgi:lipid-A-disaccharide synthase
MRIFISTGEVSGDLQGSMLIEALYRQALAAGIQLEIVALGGDRMAKAGATLIGKTAEIGSIGILESFPFILPTLKIQIRTRKYLRQNPPDALILIDYPNPNLSIGNYIRQLFPQIPIIYYIAPQDWAVPMLGHTKKIARISDRVFAIFPEEARYYQKNGIPVTWIGHPLLDRMETAPNREEARKILGIEPDTLAIALLSASRRQELKYLLPTLCQTAKLLQSKFPQVQFLFPISISNYRSVIEAAIASYGLSASVFEGKTIEAIAAADLAITKSGTVNLEIALLNVPQVVFYRVNPITAWIARHILKLSIPFMSPPNLVAMKKIVPELLQEEATPEKILEKSLELLLNIEKRQQILKDYQHMRQRLGEIGVCDRAACEILQILS